MLGVIINVFTVILGSSFGLLFRKGIPERVITAAMTAIGVCTLYIGFSGSLCGENVLIIIASMVLGAICGTLLDLDTHINKLANRHSSRSTTSSSSAEATVTATLLFCCGSMTITGSIQAGLNGDSSILISKAMLDLVSSAMLASTLGIGVLFSALPLFIIQGGLVLTAKLIAPALSNSAINELICVGSLIIIMLGTNLMKISKFKIANYLPAILFAPLFSQLASFISLHLR